MKYCIFSFLLLCLGLKAQINHPKASPFSRLEQEVGLSKITVQYSRPSAKGRKIFGALVPYGRIWRVGANESTKIKVDSQMDVLGNKLPKGTYALYAFPQEDVWQVVFHTNTDHWGDGRNNYNADEDLFRISITPETIPYHQENFLIAFDSITHSKAQLQLIWGSTKIAIPFGVDTNAQMKAEIDKQIKENPTAQTFYEASRYLQEQGLDVKQALDYVNTALEKGGDTYYFHRVKSLLEAQLGDYTSAISSAEKSLKLAAIQEKDEFVRMNQKNIDSWRAMLQKD
ncbi:MAG: DUF2911 domain-containing protein [Croceitalea sp.]|nr:DUF2911 domain-containing protein [Croceitalea sp.]NNL08646.1 DUF2911 domain-containing protein [Croceitalea sp.]NNM19420.1 DUF2911 domain-containing protein [Croceitalea sp.]